MSECPHKIIRDYCAVPDDDEVSIKCPYNLRKPHHCHRFQRARAEVAECQRNEALWVAGKLASLLQGRRTSGMPVCSSDTCILPRCQEVVSALAEFAALNLPGTST
jgi:hypothetical protein